MTEYKLPEGMCFVRDLKVGDKFSRENCHLPYTVATECSLSGVVETTEGMLVHWHPANVVYVTRKPAMMAVLETVWELQCNKLHDIRKAVDTERCRSASALEAQILSILDRT